MTEWMCCMWSWYAWSPFLLNGTTHGYTASVQIYQPSMHVLKVEYRCITTFRKKWKWHVLKGSPIVWLAHYIRSSRNMSSSCSWLINTLYDFKITKVFCHCLPFCSNPTPPWWSPIWLLIRDDSAKLPRALPWGGRYYFTISLPYPLALCIDLIAGRY